MNQRLSQLLKDRDKAEKELDKIENKLSKFNLFNYIYKTSVSIRRNENPELYDKAKCFIKVVGSGYDYDAWKAQLNPDYRKQLHTERNKELRIFTNSFGDSYVIDYLGDSIDIRDVTINSIKKGVIDCSYNFLFISNINGKVVTTYHGFMKLSIKEVEEFFNSNLTKRKGYIPPDAPIRDPYM